MSNPYVELRDVIKLDLCKEKIDPTQTYKMAGVYSFGKGLFKRESLFGGNTSYKFLYKLKADHIIMSQLFGWEGALALCTNEYDGYYVSPQFPTFLCNPDKIDRQFLGWILKTPNIWTDLKIKSKGLGDRRRTLNPDSLLSIKIALPPLNEQRSIAQKLNTIISNLDIAQALCENNMEKILALNKSIAQKLFGNIDAPTFPIEKIAEVRGGIQKSPLRIPGANPVRYLTVAHVQRNKILLDNPRYFEVSPAELEHYKLLSGDVLIIEGNGSLEQIGRTALFKGEINNCVHQNHVIRIRPNEKIIIPEYLNIYLNSPLGQEEVQSMSRTTSGLRTLSVGRIKQIDIPVPELEKQIEIINYYAQITSNLEQLEQLHNYTKSKLQKLILSIYDLVLN